MGAGGALFEGNSKLFDGPLGVVEVGFEGWDLGKTTADTTLVPDQDVKDIIFQQDGTKPSDHVRTGLEYLLNCTFGEIKTGLLTRLMAGISTANTSSADDTGTINRSIYQSMLDNEAGGLKVFAVDEDGVALTDLEHILAFYEVIPIVNGDLINWGADTQRNFPVQFRIKWHLFSAGESSTKNGAFGYWGDPTTEDVPAIVYPDLEAPIIVSSIATAATDLEITFDENIAYQTADDITHYIAKVDGVYFVPDSGSIASAVLTLVFAAATFGSGDVIEISISELALEDTETAANAYAGVDAYPCTDTI